MKKLNTVSENLFDSIRTDRTEICSYLCSDNCEKFLTGFAGNHGRKYNLPEVC